MSWKGRGRGHGKGDEWGSCFTHPTKRCRKSYWKKEEPRYTREEWRAQEEWEEEPRYTREEWEAYNKDREVDFVPGVEEREVCDEEIFVHTRHHGQVKDVRHRKNSGVEAYIGHINICRGLCREGEQDEGRCFYPQDGPQVMYHSDNFKYIRGPDNKKWAPLWYDAVNGNIVGKRVSFFIDEYTHKSGGHQWVAESIKEMP